MKTVAVYYHKADLDGLMSGVVANYYLSPRCDAVDLIPADYGDDFLALLPRDPSVYDDIYVIDVSDRVLFEALGKKITWIDHHITAMQGEHKMPPVRDQYTVNGVAACRLAFRYFTDINYMFNERDYYFNRQNLQEPWVVALAGEYDIWDKTSPLAEKLNFGVTLEFANIQYLFEQTKKIYVPPLKSHDVGFLAGNKNISSQGYNYEFINHLVLKGEGVLSYVRSTSEKTKGTSVSFEDKKGIAFNTHIRSSLIFDLKNHQEHDFMMVWNWQGGERARVSFYSEKDSVDVSKIAVRYGGGGHSKAAGCQMKIYDLMKFLDMKI